MSTHDRTGPGMHKGLLTVIVAHAVCCGVIFVAAVFGSAGLAALVGFVRNPLVQGAAFALLLGVAVYTVRRSIRKSRMRAVEKSP